MHMKRVLLASSLALAGASTAAIAHPGPHHDHGIIRGLLHAIGEPDHLGAILAVALMVAVIAIATGFRANASRQSTQSMTKRKPDRRGVE